MENVLEVIRTANESLDKNLVRQKTLNTFFKAISAEGAIFFLPEDGGGQLTSIIIKNLESTYCDYFKTYYYQFDPLQLTRGLHTGKQPSYFEKIFSYDSLQSTEYYNDFLKPQKIHHKLIVNMVADQEFYGRIVLTRPKKSRCFNKNETRIAKIVSPYLAYALSHNEFKKKLLLKKSIIEHIEEQSSIGMILLDENFNIIYRNSKILKILGKFNERATAIADTDPISFQLLKDCQDLKAGVKNCPTDGMMLPRHSMVKGPDHTHFSLISKILDQEDCEGPKFFLVSIQEQLPVKMDLKYLIETFHLSKRETEVVTLLFLGLKNEQIAQKLFVSEVTIKKHLQSIYTKAGVHNRTTLINRILTG
jgi:DNA-binding CsgD family transcriptional regulator